jgi:hypothetical protein
VKPLFYINFFPAKICSHMSKSNVQLVLYINISLINMLKNCLKHGHQDQLSIGGAKLYKYISKWDKRFLNVSWETHGGDDVTNPEQFLAKQKNVWSKLWNPNNTQLKHVIAMEFTDFREIALNNKDIFKFGVNELDLALLRYKKTSLGV